jgi:hypothetical protein
MSITIYREDSDVMERLSRFAYINRENKLVICNQEPINWDGHYLAAIRILKKIKSKKISYDIVVQLRMWLRENAEHGLGVDFGECKTLQDVRMRIDEAIRIEHLYCTDGLFEALKYNDEVFKGVK